MKDNAHRYFISAATAEQNTSARQISPRTTTLLRQTSLCAIVDDLDA